MCMHACMHAWGACERCDMRKSELICFAGHLQSMFYSVIAAMGAFPPQHAARRARSEGYESPMRQEFKRMRQENRDTYSAEQPAFGTSYSAEQPALAYGWDRTRSFVCGYREGEHSSQGDPQGKSPQAFPMFVRRCICFAIISVCTGEKACLKALYTHLTCVRACRKLPGLRAQEPQGILLCLYKPFTLSNFEEYTQFQGANHSPRQWKVCLDEEEAAEQAYQGIIGCGRADYSEARRSRTFVKSQ
jgi:hypothetical protein